MVKTSRDTLFVHPLPEHLAKHVTSSDGATPHLVYRRSFREDDVSYKDDALYPESEGATFLVFFCLMITNIVAYKYVIE